MVGEDTTDVGASAFGSSGTTEGFRTHHEWGADGSISTSVVSAVAAVTGEEPTAIEPLFEVVDPDALDQLVASVRGDERVSVSFLFEGCGVTIRGDGEIELRP